jgi:hypothetical protein
MRWEVLCRVWQVLGRLLSARDFNDPIIYSMYDSLTASSRRESGEKKMAWAGWRREGCGRWEAWGWSDNSK